MAYWNKKTSGAGGGRKSDNTLLYGLLVLVGVGFFILAGLVFLFADSFSLPVGSEKCVGIVEIDGEIMTQGVPSSVFMEGTPGSEDIADGIRGIRKRDDVGAVVLVINSPGGSVVGTREIYTAMEEVKVPKVAYLREVAASGGYYIAAGTDYVVADPNTLTGSIGVVATAVDMSGLLEKIGVNTTNIVTGRYKDIGAPNRPMTEEEYAIIMGMLRETFEEFRSVVLEGRKGKLNMERFEEVLDARVLTGRQAKEIGLVDRLGSKKDAISKAAELGGFGAKEGGEPRVCKIKITPKGGEGGLFSMEAMLTKIMGGNAGNGKVSISFE